MDKENNTNNSSKTLTDVDFYAQACSYFYYHAGQRTTMINYFIAVYGALIALYGAMLASYTLASVLTAFFMGLVSWIFYMIDIRNKFDVKESQNVIEQIERAYGVDKVTEKYPFGVFSNEANVFPSYDIRKRKDYAELRKIYKQVKKHKVDKQVLSQKIDEFIGENKVIAPHEVYQGLGASPIIPLSFCIKLLYWVCIGISLLAFAFALLLFLNII